MKISQNFTYYELGIIEYYRKLAFFEAFYNELSQETHL